MLDHGWEGERREEKERETTMWKKKKEEEWSPNLSWFQSFILVFTDGIAYEQLNINIFNNSVGDSVCKVK